MPRVLLVEDYAPNVLVASTLLEDFGYQVDVASDGFEAVEKVKANSYIAVLMDVQMQGMDGLAATKIIRQHEQQHKVARTYIIGMTAHALIGDRDRCIAAGMNEYMSKPYNPDQLEAMLAQLTRQRVAA